MASSIQNCRWNGDFLYCYGALCTESKGGWYLLYNLRCRFGQGSDLFLMGTQTGYSSENVASDGRYYQSGSTCLCCWTGISESGGEKGQSGRLLLPDGLSKLSEKVVGQQLSATGQQLSAAGQRRSAPGQCRSDLVSGGQTWTICRWKGRFYSLARGLSFLYRRTTAWLGHSFESCRLCEGNSPGKEWSSTRFPTGFGENRDVT